MKPLSQGRELKYIADVHSKLNVLKPLSQGRELKFSGITEAITPQEAPLAGAWIEIYRGRTGGREDTEAPLAGAWIEICTNIHLNIVRMKPLSQGRELKFQFLWSAAKCSLEAPLVGAWIEIGDFEEYDVSSPGSPSRRGVNWNSNQDGCMTGWYEAPLAGAWIEIDKIYHIENVKLKPLSQGRELKWKHWWSPEISASEAPFAGVWIEIPAINAAMNINALSTVGKVDLCMRSWVEIPQEQ